MTRPLIGLIGRKRSGKDTVAAQLVTAHGYERVAIADPLRGLMLDLDPLLPPVALPGALAPPGPVRLRAAVAALGWEGAKELPEVRHLLQAHGEGVRQWVGRDVWLRRALSTVSLSGGPVVITDVRYPNEADAVQAAGGVLVRVTRPGQDLTDAHISETALDTRLCDLHLVNGGTLADCRAAADDLAKRLHRV